MKVSYSEDQRRVAVRTYWRLGSYTKTIRLLGYPSRRVLCDWVSQRTKRGSLRVRGPLAVKKQTAEQQRTRKQVFTPEERLRVVTAVLEEGMSPSQAAAKFGVRSVPAIYQWIAVYRQCKSVDVMSRHLKTNQPPQQYDDSLPAHTESGELDTCSPAQDKDSGQAADTQPTMRQYLASLPDDPAVLKEELARARATIAAWEQASKLAKKRPRR